MFVSFIQKRIQTIDLYTNTIELEQGKQLAVTPVSVIITYVTAAADMHPFELQVLAFNKKHVRICQSNGGSSGRKLLATVIFGK